MFVVETETSSSYLIVSGCKFIQIHEVCQKEHIDEVVILFRREAGSLVVGSMRSGVVSY